METVGPNRARLLEDPLVARLASGEETSWFRGELEPAAEALRRSSLPAGLVEDARQRFRRFAPWFAQRFEQTRTSDGIIESPLHRAPALQARMEELRLAQLPGKLWVKRDDMLPVSGSIKARGGFHEVLQVVEQIIDEACPDASGQGPRVLEDPAVTDTLRERGIAVGSTGNLGLSIGLLSAEFGLRTTVHMSTDARPWKKDLLRDRGVEVIEHPGDFSTAVEAGRAAAQADPLTHFVDDESSLSLFAGYAVAARRLAGQLQALEVTVGEDSPLFVYLPCGVGGGPGGVAYGLKQVFGEHVHCIFAEPTLAPSMMLGVRTGLHSEVSVQDIGLSGRTTADGLAVGRPSRLVGEQVGGLIDGFVTVADQRMSALVSVLEQAEGWRVEPSATAGVIGPWRVMEDAAYLRARGLDARAMAGAHHVVWSTGGSMVPADEMAGYLEAGRQALSVFSQ
ncbi:D-serine ammonia-lyase [Brachybacterium muris]|uniref:D-serine ammonia-lyase n=1 Tax=Brachybacterium muris TaxID=219301 RepID=UPI00223AF735|nr:D-serine ammonia-lyase [Brachybacterium muris]MCT2176684.1 D-serine ammonia-lyase [Brachybacterium muris]